jgi:hypothetical protein
MLGPKLIYRCKSKKWFMQVELVALLRIGQTPSVPDLRQNLLCASTTSILGLPKGEYVKGVCNFTMPFLQGKCLVIGELCKIIPLPTNMYFNNVFIFKNPCKEFLCMKTPEKIACAIKNIILQRFSCKVLTSQQFNPTKSYFPT